ncbi:MAG: hypothetical protein ABEJ92_04495 [Halobacteriales archaeon]
MALLDPTGDESATEQQPLAPRLDSLDGARIGLFDNGKLTAEPVLDVVEDRLSAAYPEATFDRYALGKNRVNKAKDADELARVTEWATGLDAGIGAYGDCGSCTKFLAWGVDAIEAADTPAVGLIDEGFELDYQSNAIERGRPLRYAKLPVRSETPELDRVRDQLTDEAVAAIEAELTRPLSADERAEPVTQ